MAIKRALLSVSDKTGIVEMASELHKLGIELISTGGTCKTLLEAGLPVREISEITQFPEMMDGRLKTLHPLVHGGILNRRDNPQDRELMAAHGIEDIDLVIVNLYPFLKVVQAPDITWEKAIENIDIGGPTMVRSAAKNHKFVTVVVDPADYEQIISLVHQLGEVPLEQRRLLAIKALRHTAYYDSLISSWLDEFIGNKENYYPQELGLGMFYHQKMRYGENPHQSAALYRQMHIRQPSLLSAKQLQGRELSFNNFNDGNAALELMLEFTKTVAIAVKHAAPCGVALGDTPAEAFQRCYDADPVSIYGGIIAINCEIDAATAELLKPIFLEVVLAPSFSPEALAILSGKTNLRLLELGPVETWDRSGEVQLRSIRGGFLMQSPDTLDSDDTAWKVVSAKETTPQQLEDLLFAWTVVKHVRSNAIVVAKNGQTLGIGGGQVNRVDAARFALNHAGEQVQGAVLASDAYLPFDDSIMEAGSKGIAAIIQPGGSIRDEDCIKAADSLGIAMVFTGMRHFKH